MARPGVLCAALRSLREIPFRTRIPRPSFQISNFRSQTSASLLPLLVVLAALPYLINLGASSLWDANEAFYAETPRRMVETGDWLNPSFNGRPRFNKPPLSYWVVAGFYEMFGVSEAAERMAIVLGALVFVAAAFALGRLYYSTEAGLLSALVLLLSPRLLMFSRRIMIDVWVAMWMALVLTFFALAEQQPARRRLYLTLMYVSAGLGVMTKGPVAVVLPGLAILIYLALARRLGDLRRMMLPAGALIVAAVVLPWYVAIYRQHGGDYIIDFLLRDNLSRYTEEGWNPRRGFFFYVPVVFGDLFPWSLFLLGALWSAARGRRWKVPAGPAALLWVWMAVIILFFSLSKGKMDLYILPAYPAAAALIGGWLAAGGAPRLLRGLTAALGVILIVAGGAAVYVFGLKSPGIELAGAAAVGAVALAGGGAVLGLIFVRRDVWAVALSAVTVALMNWGFVLRVLPDFERYKPARPFSEIIRQRAADGALAGYYKLTAPSMAFYLRRPVFEYFGEEELRGAFASGREVYCLMLESDYLAVRDRLPGPTYILASRPVFQVKLTVLFNDPRLPQAVLVSNRSGDNSR